MQSADFVSAPLICIFFGTHACIAAHKKTVPGQHQSVCTVHFSCSSHCIHMLTSSITEKNLGLTLPSIVQQSRPQPAAVQEHSSQEKVAADAFASPHLSDIHAIN